MRVLTVRLFQTTLHARAITRDRALLLDPDYNRCSCRA